jgi:Tfp pilus assembly protein PilF
MRSSLQRFAIVAACSLACSAALADDFDQLMSEAEKRFQAGDYKEAFEKYKAAGEKDPKSAKAQAMAGASLVYLGKEDEAIPFLETGLKLDSPRTSVSAYCYQQLGLIRANKRQYEPAIDFLKKASELDPRDAKTWRNLGIALAATRKFKEAIEAWDKSLEIEPNQPTVKNAIERAKREAETKARGLTDLNVGNDSFELPDAGGFVTLANLKTLIVSIPSKSELVTYDTTPAKTKETKRAKLDFKPGRLAIQGKVLLALAAGGAELRVLDLESGKTLKTIAVPGEPVVDLACHASKGFVYVSNAKDEVFTVDLKSGAVGKTGAQGRWLAVDPKGAALFTGTTPPAGKGPERSVLRKYLIKGKELGFAASNKNAAIRGCSLHLSPDGKAVFMAGAGGWCAEGVEPKDNDIISVFSADDLVTSIGQLELGGRPDCAAFHPVLDVCSAVRADNELLQFNSKSFVRADRTNLQGETNDDPGFIGFAAHGEKVVCYRPGCSRLYVLTLVLTPDDRKALDKAYGKLPAGH